MNEDLTVDEAALIAEMTRIYGSDPMEKFLLLPFQTMHETIAFLRRIPDQTGDVGIRAALAGRVQNSDMNGDAT